MLGKTWCAFQGLGLQSAICLAKLRGMETPYICLVPCASDFLMFWKLLASKTTGLFDTTCFVRPGQEIIWGGSSSKHMQCIWIKKTHFPMCCRCMFGYMRESGTLKKLGRLSSGFNIFVPALRNAFKAQPAVVLAQNNLDNTNWNQLRRLVPLWAKRNVAWSVWALPPSSKYVGLLMRKHGNLLHYGAAKDHFFL